jgi:hypothetical protein
VVLQEDGEVLLSVAINGKTAIQIIVERARGETQAEAVTLVHGLTTAASSERTLKLDLQNFTQSASVAPGRSLVTFRAQDTGRSEMPRFRWMVSSGSALIATNADSEELGLSIEHESIRRTLAGDLLVPVRVTRKGNWQAQPVTVVVSGATSGEATVDIGRDSAVVRLANAADVSGPQQLSARVVGAYNEPRDFSGVVVHPSDHLTLGFGVFLFAGGVLVVGLLLYRGRRRLVWPLTAVLLGSALVAKSAATLFTLSVQPPEYRDVTLSPSDKETTSSVLDHSYAERFDAALAEDRLSSELISICHGVIVEEVAKPAPVRVYELYPSDAGSEKCRRVTTAVVGQPTGEQKENVEAGLVHVRLGSKSGGLDWQWGYPQLVSG